MREAHLGALHSLSSFAPTGNLGGLCSIHRRLGALADSGGEDGIPDLVIIRHRYYITNQPQPEKKQRSTVSRHCDPGKPRASGAMNRVVWGNGAESQGTAG